jgi:hypothetical protein
LRALADRRRQKLTVPVVPGYHPLAQASDFDRAYVETTIALQREQIALWDDLLRTTSDGELTRFCYDTQPLLQTGHTHAARTLQRL